MPVATVEEQLATVDRELDSALVGTTKWNESRIPVIKGTFSRLLRNVTLLTSEETSLPILEIGSDGKLASAKVLHALTGLDVVASNLTTKGLESSVGDYPITIHQNEVGKLDFPDDSFSMLFGRAVLERDDVTEGDDFDEVVGCLTPLFFLGNFSGIEITFVDDPGATYESIRPLAGFPARLGDGRLVGISRAFGPVPLSLIHI